MIEYDSKRLGPTMLEKLGITAPAQRAQPGQPSANVQDDTCEEAEAAPEGPAAPHVPDRGGSERSKWQSFVHKITPTWMHRLQRNTELQGKRGIHDPLVKEIVVEGDAALAASPSPRDGLPRTRNLASAAQRDDIDALLGPSTQGSAAETVAANFKVASERIEVLRADIRKLLLAYEPLYVPTAERLTNAVSDSDGHATVDRFVYQPVQESCPDCFVFAVTHVS